MRDKVPYKILETETDPKKRIMEDFLFLFHEDPKIFSLKKN